MMICREICVGCGRCQPYCPTGAIVYEGLKSSVVKEVCYECGTCLRAEVCPVDAITESPDVYDYPRSVRKYFSDPTTTHVTTGISGRGTEESKTNDVTLRVKGDEVGIGIEVGRPTVGISVHDIQKITQALARAGVNEIEPHKPVHSMMADLATGDLKPELLGERVLSAIIELVVKRDRLRHILRTLREVSPELESVFTLDIFTVVGPGLKIPPDVLETIESEGFTWMPNAKINMGLGRAWEKR